jgi:hypothetical protein
MLFRPDTLAAVADGRVDLAFRRWERPRVKPGGRQRTAVGVIAFDSVEPVAAEAISAQEARRAGFAAREELLAYLARRDAADIYRVTLRLAGPDPRIALRDAPPTSEEAAEIERRLARLDAASSHGPWTAAVLELIAAQPAVRAGDLAASIGRERLAFKLDVRKLKELGLTESLTVGYRVSARGLAILERLALTSAAPRQGRPRTRPSRQHRPAGR